MHEHLWEEKWQNTSSSETNFSETVQLYRSSGQQTLIVLQLHCLFAASWYVKKCKHSTVIRVLVIFVATLVTQELTNTLHLFNPANGRLLTIPHVSTLPLINQLSISMVVSSFAILQVPILPAPPHRHSFQWSPLPRPSLKHLPARPSLRLPRGVSRLLPAVDTPL